MTGTALGIVLIAAFLHAFWNTLAKKSHNKIVFIWWAILFSNIFYLPMFIYFWSGVNISVLGWACIAATGILHALYFFFVGGSYERGDLSLAYPLARGFGPFLVPIFAVIFLHEQLSLSGIIGIILVIIGIYAIHLRSFALRADLEPLAAIRSSASTWALLTGCTIAGYSLVDKVGVKEFYPPVYIYLMFFITLLLLTPYVWLKQRTALMQEWQMNKGPILLVGLLDLFTYLLILFALQISKVSYVAAAREVSIVFSALFGTIWLGESHRQPRLMASILIALGVAFIGLSR